MSNNLCNKQILLKSEALLYFTSNLTFTATEYKTYNLLLSECQMNPSRKGIDVNISVDKIEKYTKHNPKKLNEFFKKLCENKIVFEDGKVVYKAPLLSAFKYISSSNSYKYSFDAQIVNQLINFDEYYAKLDMSVLCRAESFYSLRIYELLKSKYIPNKKISYAYELGLLRFICGTNRMKSYNNYNNFKTKIIMPSVMEISKLLDVRVEFEEIKMNRKVEAIEFKYMFYPESKKEKIKLVSATNNSIVLQKDDLLITVNIDLEKIR